VEGLRHGTLKTRKSWGVGVDPEREKLLVRSKKRVRGGGRDGRGVGEKRGGGMVLRGGGRGKGGRGGEGRGRSGEKRDENRFGESG